MATFETRAGTDREGDETPTVLLLVDGERDRALLTDGLDDAYEVTASSPGGDWGTFDCVIVDDQTFQGVVDDLAAHRAAAEPMFLPVLVVAGSEERAERLLATPAADHVDDVVVVPTSARLLRTRVDSLVRTRSLSLQLDEERDQYRSLAESAQDAIIVFDDDGTVRYANPAVESTFGHAPGAVVGGAVTDLLVGDDLADLAVATATGESLLGRHADGQPVPVELSVAVSERGDGRQYTAIVRDVSDQRARERELAQSRDLLDQTQSIANVGGWEIDPETETVFWTDEVFEIVGLPVGEEPSLAAAFDLYHPEDQPVIADAVEAALTNHVPVDEELRIVRPDGEVRWVHVLGSPEVVDSDVVTLSGAFQDITEQKERELELEQSERRFRAVFEGASDALVIANDDGEYVTANPAAADLFGVPADELVGRSILEFAPADYDFGTTWSQFLQGENVSGEFPLVRRDGTELTAQFSATPNILPGRHLSVLRDITDRKLREQELERYETIVRAAADPIYAVDSTATITLANEALAAATGRSVDELLGTGITDLLDPDDVETGREHIAALADGEDPGALEVSLDTPKGHRRYEVNVALHGDGDGPGTVGVARDVTDLYQREQRLSVLDRVLRHNIRNRLNVVLGHASTLTADDSSTVRASASTIVDACEELLELSETARRFETAIHPTGAATAPLDLAAHLPHVVEDATTTHPQARVDLELGDEASLCVDAHEALELAIEEVVENAIVHCDQDAEVTISARKRPDGTVELRVTDNGPGIEGVERAALARGLETPLEHMSGLGLWFLRWTVESSGGSVTVADNEPRGTTVVFELQGRDRPRPSASRR